MKRRTIIISLCTLTIFTIYLFWGPLFPWSPIKIGVRKIISARATVYFKDDSIEDELYKFEDLLKDVEDFHGLRFNEDFKIIVLGAESNMKRFLPWIRGTGYSVKLGSVNVIYIGPNARKSPYGIEVFLKHEISHLLLHQHTGSHEKNMEILKQAWLAEGVATYFGGPHYYTKKEFVELWKTRGLRFNSLYMENPHEMDRNIIRLKYTYYRFFIEYLVDTFGLEKLWTYMKLYTHNPKDYYYLFPTVYNRELDEILRGFDIFMKTENTNNTKGGTFK